MNTPFIQLDCVSRWFGQGQAQVCALSDISLTLHKGVQTALVGPSGSGKTTLLNLIGALDRPTQGTVMIDGETVSAFSERQASEYRRHAIGFVFQDDALIPELTLAENVELPLVLLGMGQRERQQRVNELLDTLNLTKRQSAYPPLLSGGEKQRTAVARAVIHRPHILLADEPTANLDSESAELVLQVMRQLAEQNDLTVLVSTHDPRVYEQFDQLIRLRDGHLDPSAG